MENFKTKFDKILIDKLGISQEQITPEARFKEDLGADSLDMVELIMEFENEFKIRFTDDVIEGVLTIAEAEDLIRQAIKTVEQQLNRL